MPRVVRSRPRIVAVGALAIIALIVPAATSLAAVDEPTGERRDSLCADFRNTFGLYPDATVTIRGISVGSVTGIEPDGDKVRVTMDIDKRAIPASIGAVVVNSSILTDRRVELLDAAYRGGPELPEGQCISTEHTAVPVSVSDALESFSNIVGQLVEPAADGTLPLQTVLAAADREFDGLGPTINRELRQLAGLMASPDDFMSQLGQLLDNSAALSQFVTDQWGDIKTTLVTFAPGLDLLQKMLVVVKVLVEKLATAVGPMDRLFNQHFPYLLEMLESSVPVTKLIRTRLEDSSDLLGKVPGIVLMLRNMIESTPGAITLNYRPPLLTQDAAVAGIPLPQQLLSTIGGR
ncbi:MCE family protein [Aldersonia kunmingensis]|uniref:MCE family protein n=1 Tax=Aldersonia kunmingensis TaxID=408066 RepID=UPI00082A7BFC|nr:MCE family protein [Aldersonia kunmingensis]